MVWLLAALAVLWFVLLLVAPFLPVPVTAAIYAVGSLICHQRPERSFWLADAQLPVCARCLGIYAGVVGGAVAAPFLNLRRPRMTMILSTVPAVASLLLEWTGLGRPSNGIRAMTGLIAGSVIAAVGTGYVTLRTMRAIAAERTQSTPNPYLICAAAWLVPGAGHLWLGRRQKGLTFLITLTAMFAFGIWIEGRLFPFDLTQPLVALSAFGDIGIGLPYFVAKAMNAGAGRVVAITYEYGNAFIIVAGLLNMLTVLDAFDIAQGRK